MRRTARFGGWLALAAGAMLLTAGCQQTSEPIFQGYVEGEFVMVASPLGGQLVRLAVSRGSEVALDAPLFELEHAAEQAEVTAAEQERLRAANQLADLQKGSRPSELQAISAQLAETEAALELAARELERRQALFANRMISQAELDQARTLWQQDQAAVARLEAQLQTARLGARSDVVAAARAGLEAAGARLRQAQWALDQKRQRAPQSGLVFDTLYTVGEYVPPGYPVVSLLPPAQRKVRFFVPEPLVGTLHPGQRLSISFDGAPRALPARISYISPQAEYTPPVIFSRETRSKLVFMVEAHPDPEAASELHPGQPVDVRPEAGDD